MLCALLIALALPLFDLSFILVQLSDFQKASGISSTDLPWVLNVFGLALVFSLFPMGVISDYVGKDKLFRVATISLFVGYLIQAWPPNFQLLLVARALIGLSLAAFLVTTFSLFDLNKKKMPLFGIAIALGLLLGPLVGASMIHPPFAWIFSIEALLVVFIFFATRSLPKKVTKSQIPSPLEFILFFVSTALICY